MKKKPLLLTLSSAILLGTAGALVSMNNGLGLNKANATDGYTVTFTKGHNQTATTSNGNILKFEEQYTGDFIFDAEDTYFAATDGTYQVFMGLTADSIIRRITGFSIDYEQGDIGAAWYHLYVSFYDETTWDKNDRAELCDPVPGQRYTFDDVCDELYFCSSAERDDTYRHIVIQDYCTNLKIKSITIEYACD